MTQKDFRGRAVAEAARSEAQWRIDPTIKCAHIGCALQSCVTQVPFRSADAAMLERSTLVRNFERGEKIFSEGDPAGGLYCIRGGVALVSYKDALRAERALRMVGPGDLVGYRSLFAEEPHITTAEALTACHICFFPKTTIMRLTDTYPMFSRSLFRKLARDQGSRNGFFVREQHLPIRLRFVHFLRMMGTRYGTVGDSGSIRVKLPMMRRQIASLLSARPESVARAITELEREGLAVFDGRNVTIPDPDALYRIIDDVAELGRHDQHH